MAYTNSSLATYTKISPNKTSPRNHIIDTITIHCMAGNLTVESCGDLFAQSSRQASSNYGIGTDGRIALYVEEKDRSWCSSNSANDHRAVTIEVANDGGAPDWHVSDKAMASLINLVADICKRNNIKELRWQADKSLIGQVTKQNMTVHRWFAAKACPGDYLYNNHSYIAAEVNKKLGVQSNVSSASVTSELYRVRKIWTDASTQIGAYSILENAKAACKDGYSVFDNNGNVIYTKTPTIPTAATATTTSSTSNLKVISTVKSVQTWLNTYYKTGIVTDGIYGSQTKAALVKAWQTEVGGLSVDGVFGAKSKTASTSCILKTGSTGILVTIWQAYLVCRGYNPNGIDGTFGIGCKTATIAFQKANGLTQDGQVGQNTWTKAFV